MSFDDVKNFTSAFLNKLSKSKLLQAFHIMRNKVEDMEQENLRLQKANKDLKNENRKLKGEPREPNIKPPTQAQKAEANNLKGEKEKKNKNHKQGGKKDKIEIHERRELRPDPKALPKDVEYHGKRSIYVQDLKFTLNNTEFIKHRFICSQTGKTFEGELPPEYRGSEFGPGIWALVKQLHFESRVTQNLISKMLLGLGVKISSGQVNNIIMRDKGIDFKEELERAREEAIKKGGFLQIDDTGARVKGKNGYVIAVVNRFISYFFTGAKKDRFSCIKAIVGGNNLKFCINELALKYIEGKKANKTLVKWLRGKISERVYTEGEFEAEIMNKGTMKEAIPIWRKYIKEGCAIGALRMGKMGPIVRFLMGDDAPQFKGIFEQMCLCWVHEMRRYKALEPRQADFKETLDSFMEEMKDFYKGLKEYKTNSTEEEKKKLKDWFNKLFGEETSYYALNRIQEKTFQRRDFLLVVLKHPWIPLHNNDTEQSIRKKVIQKNIQHKHDTWAGARVNDLYLSLMETCRKLDISFGEYLKDRFQHRNEIPPLAEVITSMP